MRRKTLIFLLLGVFIFMMADTNMPLFKRKNKQAVKDSLEMLELTASDSLETDSLPVDSKDGVPDTAKMDSLELAIYKHNKAVDDSIKADSVFRAKAGGIDAPVTYEAQDSLVYDAATKTAHLYGKAKVKYTNMDLSSEKVYMSLDSSIVHATGVADTAGNLTGTPVFKMGSDTYENDTMAFNFKSKKGLISNVYTEQEDGFLRSQRAKRDSSGALYLTHGRYTTCDEEHPDFYIALSRAKCALERMSSSDLPTSWWPMCPCLWPFLMDSSHSRRVTAAVSLCLLMAMKAAVDSISAMAATISR